MQNIKKSEKAVLPKKSNSLTSVSYTHLEFGSRRAQGANAAVDGARAAYIGGCKGTACTLTDELYGVPALSLIHI